MTTRILPKVISEDQALQLFAQTYNPHHRLQLMLMYYCGLRVSEMLALRLDAIDFKTEYIKVIQGKGGKDRLVPIPKPLIRELKQYLAVFPRTGTLIYTHRRNTAAFLQRLGAKLGISWLHPHTLRHVYATHILEKTNNLLLVKELLGHESIATTQIYTHLTKEAKKTAVDGIWK